eukprot:5683004-Amphidinium_carterae.1
MLSYQTLDRPEAAYDHMTNTDHKAYGPRDMSGVNDGSEPAPQATRTVRARSMKDKLSSASSTQGHKSANIQNGNALCML